LVETFHDLHNFNKVISDLNDLKKQRATEIIKFLKRVEFFFEEINAQ